MFQPQKVPNNCHLMCLGHSNLASHFVHPGVNYSAIELHWEKDRILGGQVEDILEI